VVHDIGGLLPDCLFGLNGLCARQGWAAMTIKCYVQGIGLVGDG